MGFEIHLTRRTHWHDEEGPDIAREEWLAAVLADPELALPDPDSADAKFGDHYFAFRDHRVSVKHPDVACAKKLLVLAARLGAHVETDDGVPVTTADFAPRPRRWWQFWR